ncbi:MAG: hypothetical protein CML99_06415 [Rhodobiaceae bacterium]|nr:hypothetical protein [Rhodobiaceae bacterium]
MNKIEQSLLEQMKFSDFEISKRKVLFDLTETDFDLLRSCRLAVVERLDWAIDEFYARQLNNPEIALIIGDSDTLGRLKNSMRGYIVEIFEGNYDEAYVNSRLRVGKVHWRIGVTPKYFLSALRLLYGVLCTIIEESSDGREEVAAKEATLLKMLFFDSQLVFDTYIFALQSEVMAAQDETSEYADSLEKIVATRTQQLRTLALTDELTGVNNKRAFYEHAKRELSNAQRHHLPLSLIYVDVNEFKQLNDTLGHSAGDNLLTTLTKNLSIATRDSDILCRLGGDEFCVLLPDTNREGTAAVADRFASLMAADPAAIVGASVGIATTGPVIFLQIDDLLHKADLSMYQAKAKIRGQDTGTISVDYGEAVPSATSSAEHIDNPNTADEFPEERDTNHLASGKKRA